MSETIWMWIVLGGLGYLFMIGVFLGYINKIAPKAMDGDTVMMSVFWPLFFPLLLGVEFFEKVFDRD